MSRDEAHRQRLAEAGEPAALGRRADQDVGRAALARDARRHRRDVVALLDDEVRAEHRGDAPQRLELRAAIRRRLLSRGRGRRGCRGRRAAAAPSAMRGERRARSSGRASRAPAGAPRTPSAPRSRTAAPRGAPGIADEPLRLDLLRHLPQRDLAQRLEVLDAEEVLQRRLHAPLRVDAPFAQACDQRLGRDVDEHHLVRLGEQPVRERLAHAHAGQLGDLVVQRLEVLDVDGGEHVDPGLEQVRDVLVALAVLDARRVGVRELVDEAQLGRPRQQPGEIHLAHRVAAVVDDAEGLDLEPLCLRRRLRPPVRLEHADDDVAPVLRRRATLLQHAVGLADARRHAQEDLAAARPLRRRGRRGRRGR